VVPGEGVLKSARTERRLPKLTGDACTAILAKLLIAYRVAARELGQAMPVGVQRQLEAVGNAQLRED
jgi:hypothetical protein